MLLEWSRNDPVSDKETNRNDGINIIQENRNPFIDYPELVDFIWGTRNGEQWRPGIGNSNFVVSPNPASSYVSVQISQPEQASFMIYDLSGIYLKNGKINSDGTIDISDLNNGIYLLTIYAHHIRKVEKLIVAHEKLIQN
ncbi:MAG TPA: T9SS type A sorting domain-containing protein, partial [Paludibacteraceae bacterium]|nr:T9SS type A sorting domain-containing protein [Paludibacteraceae bacterium]